MLFLILVYVLCQLCRGSYTCFYDLVCRLLSSFARTSLKESRVELAARLYLFFLIKSCMMKSCLFCLLLFLLLLFFASFSLLTRGSEFCCSLVGLQKCVLVTKCPWSYVYPLCTNVHCIY